MLFVIFWLQMASTYKTLTNNAAPHLLVSPSTLEYAQGFSNMMAIKSKVRNRFASPGHNFVAL